MTPAGWTQLAERLEMRARQLEWQAEQKERESLRFAPPPDHEAGELNLSPRSWAGGTHHAQERQISGQPGSTPSMLDLLEQRPATWEFYRELARGIRISLATRSSRVE
jgi:hypothetical protein